MKNNSIGKTMKAMVLTGIQQIEVRDLPVPEPKYPTDVLLKTRKVGVCGSDIHYYKHGRIGDQVIRFPHTIGHECSAEVAAVGNEVTRVKPGELVAVDPAISCGECDQCKAGRFHTCRKIRFLAVPGQLAGCMAEYLVMPETSCYKIADSISAEQAALIEPLTIGYYAVELAGEISGKNTGILGVGPIGLCVLQVLLLKNVTRIYATDKLDYRLTLAQNAGAQWIGNPEKSNIAKEIEKIEPLLLDVVFECCGQQEALNQAVTLLKPGGKLVIVGIPEEDFVSFNISDLRRKEITIINIRRQNECVTPVIDLLERKKIKPDFMITHHFSLDEVARAFATVSEYRDGVVKAMIDID